MAQASEAALRQQAEGDIPFREGYFLPEDEAGASGTLRGDKISSDEGSDGNGEEPQAAPEAPASRIKVNQLELNHKMIMVQDNNTGSLGYGVSF